MRTRTRTGSGCKGTVELRSAEHTVQTSITQNHYERGRILIEINVCHLHTRQVYGTCHGVTHSGAHWWYLSSLLVTQGYREAGFGTQLLRAFEQAAWGIALLPIQLTVDPFSEGYSSRRLWRWYRKRGYERVSGKTACIYPPPGITDLAKVFAERQLIYDN